MRRRRRRSKSHSRPVAAHLGSYLGSYLGAYLGSYLGAYPGVSWVHLGHTSLGYISAISRSYLAQIAAEMAAAADEVKAKAAPVQATKDDIEYKVTLERGNEVTVDLFATDCELIMK